MQLVQTSAVFPDLLMLMTEWKKMLIEFARRTDQL